MSTEQKYYAVGTTDYMGPFESEDEAYEAYLRDRFVEPNQILLGTQTGKAIEGQVVWEIDG